MIDGAFVFFNQYIMCALVTGPLDAIMNGQYVIVHTVDTHYDEVRYLEC